MLRANSKAVLVVALVVASFVALAPAGLRAQESAAPGSVEELRAAMKALHERGAPLRAKAAEVLAESGVDVRRDIVYAELPEVDPRRLSLDLYLDRSLGRETAPAASRAPIILYVHGGAWVGGSKEQALFKPAAFVPAGFVFASANYRFRPEATLVEMAQSVADAAGWLVRNADDFGGDPDRLFLMGHSAGAHLVSLLGTNESFLKRAGVTWRALRGVVSLDTAVYDLPKLMASGTARVQALAFAGNESLFEQVSPWHHASYGSITPPFLLFYSDGRGDATTQTIPFGERLREAGREVMVIEAKGRDHSGLDAQLGTIGDEPTRATIDFLERHAAVASYTETTLDTDLVPGVLEYSVLRPRDAGDEPLPILLFLHGGGGDRSFLAEISGYFERAWRDGSLPPMLVATPSTSRQSYYLDYKDGSERWTTLLVSELPNFVAERFGGDPRRVAIAGYSMGGVGALRVALQTPERFVAAAAMAAGLEPALSYDELPEWYEPWKPSRIGAKFGHPVDADHWARNNPASIVAADPDRLRRSALWLLVECGEDDELSNFVGNEFLHQVLVEHEIPHEYRLVRAQGHVPVAPERLESTLAFLGRAFSGPSDLELQARERFQKLVQPMRSWRPPARTRGGPL